MAVLRYTLLRALILVVVGALLWLAGFRSFTLLFGAVFVSGIISIFVLRRSRDQLSATLDKRVSTIKNRLEQRTAAEDAWNDAERLPQEAPESPQPRDPGPVSGPGPVSSS